MNDIYHEVVEASFQSKIDYELEEQQRKEKMIELRNKHKQKFMESRDEIHEMKMKLLEKKIKIDYNEELFGDDGDETEDNHVNISFDLTNNFMDDGISDKLMFSSVGTTQPRIYEKKLLGKKLKEESKPLTIEQLRRQYEQK